MFEGKIEVIPGKNPHHMNSKTEKEISKGEEKVKDAKRRISNEPKSDKKGNRKSRDENQSPNTDRVVLSDQDSGKLSVKNGSLEFRGAGKDGGSTVVIGGMHDKGFY